MYLVSKSSCVSLVKRMSPLPCPASPSTRRRCDPGSTSNGICEHVGTVSSPVPGRMRVEENVTTRTTMPRVTRRKCVNSSLSMSRIFVRSWETWSGNLARPCLVETGGVDSECKQKLCYSVKKKSATQRKRLRSLIDRVQTASPPPPV